MQRYFNNKIINNGFIMNEDDTHHIKKVMRMSIGDHIEVVCEKIVYECEIESISDKVNVRIINNLLIQNELPIKITVCQSLVNEQKMDMILQKGVELGMTELIPYKAHNSVIKDNGKGDKKIVRWQRIVKEASEQSKRNVIPKVSNILNIEELIKLDYDLKLLCSVKEVTKSIKNVIQSNKKCDTLIIVVGPEGGFTDEEESKLVSNGYVRVSLGSRVLRTETASLVALSYLNYELMR